MKPTPLISALMLMSAWPVTASAQQAATTDEDTREIVVTGRSLKETGDALAACLARKCPPDEDVAASLAHAENQFIKGNYRDARLTLRQSVGRNRKHGKAYPVPVSDLLRANGRVAEHNGEARDFQTSVLDMRDTLKAGLGPDDPRVLVAQIEVGDSRAKLGFPDEALRIYKDVTAEAVAKKHARVATFALIRQGLLWQTIAEVSKDKADLKKARAILEAIVSAPMAGAEDFTPIARVLLARMDRQAGDAASTDAIVREFAAQGGTERPLLLASEPIGLVTAAGTKVAPGTTYNSSQLMAAQNSVGSWADIGFWITADGKVSDVEVLRAEGSQQWLKPVFAHLKSRIYAPLKRSENDANPGFYMIERYSLTARWTSQVTGTRMERREPALRIERLDITPDTYQRPMTDTKDKDAG